MAKGQAYRHTPAFILLILASGRQYGAALLSRLETELPGMGPDSASVYRALQELEDEGCVSAEWETDISGPARKWYSITAAGKKSLASFKEDIEARKRNLEWFLERYAGLEAPSSATKARAAKVQGANAQGEKAQGEKGAGRKAAATSKGVTK
ncbi:MAG TPA: PadR family transcriptional regulator [Rectinemataceae bacterium]|nr:PadR family transcriptional regulator [Rectinemataceae bacterium]